LFAIGGIYQNNLGEKKSAAFYYNELLRRFPDSKYKAQVYYELAKMAKAEGNNADYEKYRADLAKEFPESIYLKLVDNPNGTRTNANSGPGMEMREIENMYMKMYAAYVAEAYDDALSIKQETDKKYAGNNLQPKFDYLAALCTIKK